MTTRKSQLVSKFGCGNKKSVETVANLDQSMEVNYTLWEVLGVGRKKLRISIIRDGFEYSRGVHTVEFSSRLKGDRKSIEKLMVSEGAHERLKALMQVTSEDERHQFAVLSQLAPREEAYGRKLQDIRMCSIIRKDWRTMTAHKIVFYGCSCNNTAGIAISYVKV